MTGLLLLIAALALGGCKDKTPAHVDEGAKTPSQVQVADPKLPADKVEGAQADSPVTDPKLAAPPKPASTAMTPDSKLKRYTECLHAFNAGKDEVFGSCFSADSVREQVDSVPDVIAQGPERILEMAKAQRASFPDLKVTPQLIVVSGSDILAILHVTGTNTLAAGGMKATGKKLGVFEAQLAVLGDDGKFSHESFYVDQPTIFHQLGLLENESSPNAIEKHLGNLETLISQNDASELANKALVQKDLDAVNKKDPKAIEALVADDIKFTFHGEKQKIDNKKAYMKWVKDDLRWTKDGKVEVIGMWAAGDTVVVSDVFRGTPIEGGDGKRVEIRVAQFFRIKDGKIKHHHIFINRFKTAVELGQVDPDQLTQALSGSGEAHDAK